MTGARWRGRCRPAAPLVVAALAGCGALGDDEISVETVDGWTAIGRSAEVQITILRSTDSGSLFCMAPEPDAVSTFQEGVTLAMLGSGASERIGEEARRGALGLGGRNPHVLLARDVFYRACEVVINHRLGPEEAVAALSR